MRKSYVSYLTILLVATGILLAAQQVMASKTKVSEAERLAAQGAMRNFILGKLSAQEGMYDINGVKAEFDYLHNGVKRKGQFFVSCADFKAGNDVYDIDYYVKKVDGQYIVVKEEYHKKNGILVDEVLWQKE